MKTNPTKLNDCERITKLHPFRSGSLGQYFSLSVVKILQLTRANMQGLAVSEDINETIEKFCLWQQGQRTEEDDYDLAVLVTRKDLCQKKNGEKSCNILGLGMCVSRERLKACNHVCLTKLFAISPPQILPTSEFYVAQNHRSTEYPALKL